VERQCWAFRQSGLNLSRCSRVGNWTFYCDQHRWQPLTIAFLLFTVLGTIASYQGAGWLFSSKPSTALWVRITDTRNLKFDGDIAVIPKGEVRGNTLSPRSHVFLMMRVVRACKGPFDCTNYPHPRANYWHISETSVDAQGNWTGSPCAFPWHGDAPIKTDFQYWELIAVALDDGRVLRSSITPQNCAVNEDVLMALPSLVCSETAIALHGQPDGYTMHYEHAPQPRRYCFGREFFGKGVSAWVRIGDTSDVHFAKQQDSGSPMIGQLQGTVRGAISTGEASVFLLWRRARQCFHQSSEMSGGLKGASIPTCEERNVLEDRWSVREAVLDARGDWSAPIGPNDEIFSEDPPWVEFWQVQAVATLERQTFADRITPFGTISADSAREVPHLLCSEPRIIPHSEIFSGSWRNFEPTDMAGICK